MKIWAYPLDTFGCGHYRIWWPICAVEELAPPGVEIEVVTPSQRTVAIEFRSDGSVAKEHFPAQAGDVIWFQRTTSKFQPEAIRILQARGVAVVIDMDDDLGQVHPRNIAHWQMRPKVPMVDPATGAPVMKDNVHSWHNAVAACREAALVTVTTPALAQTYAPHGRVAVLPNCVPAEYLAVEHRDSEAIGWAGVVPTHPDDLQQLGPAIARLVRDDGALFTTVGDPVAVDHALGLDNPPLSTGPLPLANYPAAVARFGIGIAPLAPTKFNRAKSWLKPLEYAALGVPWVGSPLPDYVALHRRGCGLLAEKPRQWEGILRRLIRNPAQRADLSEAGRQVAATLTMEANAWRWVDAWRQAVENVATLTGREPGPRRSEWRLPEPR